MNYEIISTEIKNKTTETNNEIELINKIEFNSNWSGISEEQLIKSLNNTINQIKEIEIKLKNYIKALSMVEEYKEVSKKIEYLEGEIVNLETNQSEIINQSINIVRKSQIESTINKLKQDKSELRKNILNIIKSINSIEKEESSIEDINFSYENISGELIQKYKNGTLYKFTAEDDQTFEVYIPNKYSKDASVIVYEHGDGSYEANWKMFETKFEKEGCNTIIIRGKRQISSNFYDCIVKECNLENPNPIVVSHSGGTPYALQENAKIIQNNQIGKPTISVIMDGNVLAHDLESKGVVQTFKNNNTIVLGFAQGNDGANYAKGYKELAKKGVNVLILYDNSEYGKSHGKVNTSFIESNILEYVTGEGNLPENYTIQRYDSNKQEFVDVNLSDISKVELLYNCFNK